MTEKITSLTQEQIDAIPVHRDEWIGHGLSTEPANREAAEEGINNAYRLADLSPPEHIIWRDSPLEGAKTAQVLLGVEEGTKFKTTADLEEFLSTQEVDSSGNRNAVFGAVYGQHDAPRLGFLEFFIKYCGLDDPEFHKIDGLIQVAKNAGWWWPFQDICVISERPFSISRNNQNELHKEDGPAIEYPDGWGIYAWNGTRVPKDLILYGWDTSRILQEENTEIRRCAIEKMGWPTFVEQAGLTQVGESVPDPGNDPHMLTLYDVPEQIYDEPVRVLLCTNATENKDGTRNKFGLTVPASISDPVSAAAWTFGLNPTEYKELTNAS